MKPILLAVLAGLCWGIGELFTKSVLHTKQVGPITALAVRTTVALPVIWFVYALAVHAMKVEPRDWPRAEPGVLWKLLLGSGLVAGAGGALFFYAALNVGEITRVKPIAFSVAPATAVVLAWLFLGEVVTPRKAIAVVLILAGVVLLTGGTENARPQAAAPSVH